MASFFVWPTTCFTRFSCYDSVTSKQLLGQFRRRFDQKSCWSRELLIYNHFPKFMKVPVSPYNQIDGLVYFPRMLDKARLFARSELREDLCGNLGLAMDAWTCALLSVSYADVVTQVGRGLDDRAVLDWCYAHGKKPTDQERRVWNAFMIKVGWRDSLAAKLALRKAESGLADRQDIQTMFDYIDADEGREPGDPFAVQ
jgi:hypothetical protein